MKREEELPLGRGLDFLRLLWGLHHALEIRSKQMTKTLGVTGPQRLVIRIVGRFPQISAGRLAEILRLHPSTITGIITRLEERRLMTRKVDPRDRRRALLGLTAEGRKIDEATRGTIEATVVQALAALRPEDVEAARDVLAHLGERLSEVP
jgi:MarR family transcriptional regulator, organic hydroperoxide resistance regulator